MAGTAVTDILNEIDRAIEAHERTYHLTAEGRCTDDALSGSAMRWQPAEEQPPVWWPTGQSARPSHYRLDPDGDWIEFGREPETFDDLIPKEQVGALPSTPWWQRTLRVVTRWFDSPDFPAQHRSESPQTMTNADEGRSQ